MVYPRGANIGCARNLEPYVSKRQTLYRSILVVCNESELKGEPDPKGWRAALRELILEVLELELELQNARLTATLEAYQKPVE